MGITPRLPMNVYCRDYGPFSGFKDLFEQSGPRPAALNERGYPPSYYHVH